ncbi:MAG TPA: hypothetical protein DEH78_04570 [Solibacterales bacterium]|nr:hypothetical protein [Bryobacterales bacterium]
MPLIDWNRALHLLPALALASIAPNAFPAAQLGYATLHELALYAILPSFAILLATVAWSFLNARLGTARVIAAGALAGMLATLALEAIRYPGFLLGWMPGNLPELMGVLLLDRFSEGPSIESTIAGFAYHAWNGASFGIIFAILAEIGIVRRTSIWAVGYGVLIGVGFLASPVVQSLGGGFLGVEFGWRFAATVLVAHAAFGFALSTALRMALFYSRRVTRIAPSRLSDASSAVVVRPETR